MRVASLKIENEVLKRSIDDSSCSFKVVVVRRLLANTGQARLSKNQLLIDYYTNNYLEVGPSCQQEAERGVFQENS
jgi:hypothetical protein